jgi:hypothetical protein
MDAQRRDAMIDPADAIDREIRAALAVEPSAEFVARVRTRLASEPAAAGWSWRHSWGFALTAVAAVAIALALYFVRPVNVPPPDAASSIAKADVPLDAAPPPAPSRSPESLALPVPLPTPSSNASRPMVARRPVAQPRSTDPAPPPEAEILIDARESSALRALILGARDGRVNLEPVLRASTPAPMDLPPVGAIDIPFLTIDPIAPGTGEEGVRQ